VTSTATLEAVKTVVVADDTAFVRDRFRAALAQAGHETLTVRTGAELLGLMRRNGERVDLIALDLRLPQGQGVQLVRDLQKLSKHKPIIAKSIDDPDPLVREVAARTLRDADPALRLRVLPRILDDPVRSVRMEAARSLAGEPERRLPTEADRIRFERAIGEYVAALEFNADRPEAQAEFGSLLLARGRGDAALEALRRAVALDPTFVPAAINLADAYRALGREAEVEATLQATVKVNPAAAAPRNALGLSYTRQKRPAEALAAFAEATRLEPDDARYAYVYAVALHDAGRRADAIKALDRALSRHPYDRDVLVAAAIYEREAGNAARARQRAQTLVELDPDNAEMKRFAAQFM